VLVDADAASQLEHTEYYHYTHSQKPDWQAY
jgi:hypothetical protein